MSEMNLGDVIEDDTIYFNFHTHKADGTPIVLGGTPVLSVYKDNNAVQSTAGITLGVDHDSVVGLNNVALVLTDAFYVADADYSVVITTGTVDGVSVVGYTVAYFSIHKRSALRPTTSARTLAVAATGEASADVLKINSLARPAQVLERWMGIGHLGVVLADGGNSTTQVKLDISEPSNDQFAGSLLVFDIDAALDGAVRTISSYTTGTDLILYKVIFI